MRIFKISRNPVSTIESALKPLDIPKPQYKYIKNSKFVSPVTPLRERANNANYFVKMRNGIGRLMKHFSHPKHVSE